MKMNKNKEKGEIKGVYLLERHWKILDKHARKKERSRNWIIMKIVDNWINRNRKELRAF